ncbi:MAG: preprotein translocase subunit SecG [Alphaproteobacteria bacterium]|nr:preprotein translocase subunit SecG [Alphaproteobacteria bacterium]
MDGPPEGCPREYAEGTMESVLLVIHLIVAVSIIALVLVQPAESGGFMGSSGTMSNLMMPRRSGDVLTRATTLLAAVFFTTSMFLAIAASHRPAQKSILDGVNDGAAKKPALVIKTGEAKPDDKKKEVSVPAAPADKDATAVKKPAETKTETKATTKTEKTPTAPVAK